MKRNSITRVLAALLLALLATVSGVSPIALSGVEGALAAGGSFTYTAQKGDTYSDLSWRYGVSLSRLLAANAAGSNGWLTPGQQVVVPVDLGATPSLVNPFVYRVQPGDTLGLLSVRYEIAAWAAAKANGLGAVNMTAVIPANTTLLIPAGPHIHKLDAGETLADVAALYGVSESYLLKVNNLDSEKASVAGALITVPTQYDLPFTPMPGAAAGAPVTAAPALTASGGPLAFRWVGINSPVTALGAGRASVVLVAEFKGGTAPYRLKINSWGQYATTRGPFTKVDNGQAWIDLDFDANFQCGESFTIDATVYSADGQSAYTIRQFGPMGCMQ